MLSMNCYTLILLVVVLTELLIHSDMYNMKHEKIVSNQYTPLLVVGKYICNLPLFKILTQRYI